MEYLISFLLSFILTTIMLYCYNKHVVPIRFFKRVDVSYNYVHITFKEKKIDVNNIRAFIGVFICPILITMSIMSLYIGLCGSIAYVLISGYVWLLAFSTCSSIFTFNGEEA
jgi:hypothetical protein